MITIPVGTCFAIEDEQGNILAVILTNKDEKHHLIKNADSLNIQVVRPAFRDNHSVEGYYRPLAFMLGENSLSYPLLERGEVK